MPENIIASLYPHRGVSGDRRVQDNRDSMTLPSNDHLRAKLVP